MGKACKTRTQFYTFFFFSLQRRPGWRIWFFHSMPLAWGEILIFPLSLLHAHLLNQFAPDLMLWHVGRCTRLTVTDDGSGQCPLHVTAGSGWPASRPRLLLGRTQSRAQYTHAPLLSSARKALHSVSRCTMVETGRAKDITNITRHLFGIRLLIGLQLT